MDESVNPGASAFQDVVQSRGLVSQISSEEIATPIYEKLVSEAKRLDALSEYPCSFDYEVYRQLEVRYTDRPVRGGIIKGNPFKLVNAHHTCQQCLYAFEVDTYGRGCTHNCTYCYAKAELTVHGMWNI